MREKIIFVLFVFSFLMCCANKAIGTLAFLKKGIKAQHIMILICSRLTKRKKIHVDKAET